MYSKLHGKSGTVFRNRLAGSDPLSRNCKDIFNLFGNTLQAADNVCFAKGAFLIWCFLFSRKLVSLFTTVILQRIRYYETFPTAHLSTFILICSGVSVFLKTFKSFPMIAKIL